MSKHTYGGKPRLVKQSICTTYHGPTNTRGSRITAVSGSGQRISVPFDYDLSLYDAHEKAAYALCKKLGWEGELIGGGTKNGYCFVFVS